jgi:hypothetical protein
MNDKGHCQWQKIKKPPTAFAGGGLDTARLLNPVRQAPLPARVLEPLIRRSGTDTAMRCAVQKLALANVARMTMIGVEQRCGFRVKTDSLAAILNVPSYQPSLE